MTPEQFVAKWRSSTRTEESAAQEHFLDLCELLDVKKPAEIDPHGTEYTFEKATQRLGGASGYADVWKRSCFAWEGLADVPLLKEGGQATIAHANNAQTDPIANKRLYQNRHRYGPGGLLVVVFSAIIPRPYVERLRCVMARWRSVKTLRGRRVVHAWRVVIHWRWSIDHRRWSVIYRRCRIVGLRIDWRAKTEGK